MPLRLQEARDVPISSGRVVVAIDHPLYPWPCAGLENEGASCAPSSTAPAIWFDDFE
jgi:hypothetical protein